MPIPLLVAIELSPDHRSFIKGAGFEVYAAPTVSERAEIIRSRGDEIRAVLTNGTTGFGAHEIASLPNLEIICALGAGYENVGVAAARARGIIVTHGPGANAASVADHAMALLMSIARDVVQSDAAVRRGDWVRARHMRPMISGKKLGILGLGNIGEQIAKRGFGGFGMPIAYHSRKPRDGSPWLHLPTPTALAEWSDYFVVATPGGAATRRLVGTAVLDALGPEGFLINIARGSVVDTAALIEALRDGRIAGAALDVIDGEPEVPSELIALRNVIITPHLAGLSPEAVQATVQLVLNNLQAHFRGRPVLTPVIG
ncbi:2-hydroxyacid dehydrogenase [Aquabacter sp. CN5-332]|uniref:2-hydroxyacid dehydrogenase n=1 Tax=Aquabacter sp. CN5-332 TaxID=3156608 RepID=UPI0032B4C68F